MGKRKQKVRWCIVDGLAWNNGNEEEGSTGEVGQLISPAPVAKGGEGVGGGGGRGGGRGGDGWGGTVAPRFERKAAAEQKHIYYEGEYCEAEELPNGFTKIRSKNLDILFKRDYYEQRLAVQQRLQSEQAEKEAAEEVTEEEHDTTEETRESTSTEEGSMGSTTGPAVIRATKSFDQMDPSEIPEFKPTNSRLQDLDGVDSGHTSPFYGNYSPYPTPQEYGYNQAPPRPNLYLYSPSNNTLIPCEEIIIPNPVMSPEGPVYSGPTNIYLAYPVQGPDGRGYITQPFNGPNNPSGMATSYSPPSCDSGTCFSSAPHTTPNSGQDSGSSTQPTSPPPLVSYHPTNWVRPHASHEDGVSLPPSFLAQAPRQERESVEVTEKGVRPTPRPPMPTPSPRPLTAAAPSSSLTSAPTITYIPGLPDHPNTPKKSQKRRKKKKPEANRELLEHRGSTSSESEVKFLAREEEREQQEDTVQELHLTDDLADSLVNPPTEPEQSDDEPTLPKTCRVAEDIVAVKPVETAVEMDMEVEVEEELFLEEAGLEDREVQDITSSLQMEDVPVETTAAVDLEIEPVVKECLEAEPAVESWAVPETTIEAKMQQEETQDSTERSNVNDYIPVVAVKTEEASTVDTVVKAAPVEIVKAAPAEVVKAAPVEVVKAAPAEAVVEAKVAEPAQSDAGSSAKASSRSKQRNRQGGRKPWAGKKERKTSTEAAANSEVSAKPEDATAGTTAPKMSYSSVMKSNLTVESSCPPAPAAIKASAPVPSQKEKVVLPSRGQEAGARMEGRGQEAVARLEGRGQGEDTWEPVPLSVSQPENWEKTPQSKKRKHKKIASRESVHFETPVEEPEVLMKPEPVKEQVVAVPAPVVKQEPVVEEEEQEEQEEQEDKKRVRRRKKKHGSEDPDDGHGGRRVVICDDQVEIRFSRSIHRATEVLSEPQIDKVKTSGYCDFLIVSELGCGIQRGCMGLGRLYQGKYVPPERTDGLLPEEKRLLEEAREAEERMEQAGEDNLRVVQEVEEEAQEAPAPDIDLD